MATPTIIIPVSMTSDELAGLEIVTQVYLDLLEVVEPLTPDKTRLEVVTQLSAFKDRCQEIKAQGQAPAEALFSIQVPFQELMVVATAIEAYEYMDRIHCAPVLTSHLAPMDVIKLTRSFQRRMIHTQSKS